MTPEVQRGQREERRYLVVGAGRRRCALPVATVRRVMRNLVVYPVPGSAPAFLGLAQLGGEPFPVLDLATVMSEERGAGGPRRLTIVVRGELGDGPGLVGLAVEEAVGIRRLGAAQTVPDESGGGGHTVSMDGETVWLVDVERVCSSGGAGGGH
jgi:chemotaxis signal transduction protein